MLKRLLTIQFLFLLGITSPAQDVLPDSLLSDTVLSVLNSPYYMTHGLVIDTSVTLEIEAGVQLIISDGLAIRNNGRFIISGTEKNPVLFTALDSNRWAYIGNYGSFFAKNLNIRKGTRFITSYGDTVIIEGCSVLDTYGTVGDDCIGVHYADKVLVLNSVLVGNPEAGKTDALDIDGVTDDTISGNQIAFFSDDGVDIGTGSENVVISHNVIANCDQGISVGENSTAYVYRNLITRSTGGIQSHYGSIVIADQNTLYGNRHGIRAFHNTSEETSSGTIYLSNSIISHCTRYELLVKDSSVVTVNYCLTDSLLLEGNGNLTGDPAFIDTSQNNFKLGPNSAAIDMANPDQDGDGSTFTDDPDDRDPDGTRLDIGYMPFYHTSLRIVEISPSNLSLFPDDSGNFTDWIKIVNDADVSINLHQYYLSDNKEIPLKYKVSEDLIIQGGDTLTFWADNWKTPLSNHLPFKLSGDGEYISISNPNGDLLAEKEFSRVPVNYILRCTGPGEDWVYSEWPVTDSSKKYIGICTDPVYSVAGGESTFPVSLSLTSLDAEASVYYSFDSSDPSSGSLFTAPISIAGPKTARSLVRKEGHLDSYIHAQAYYEDSKYHLPVMSLSTNEVNLYGPSGIYSNYSKQSNYWERPASVAYYDGDKSFSAITGIKIQGGNSVYMPKKSFRFHFRGGYGSSRLEGSPFEGGPLTFKNLVVRAGYDDDITTTTGTMLRDPLSTELWSRLDELATKSSWTILLLNNDYWGVYNVRESINEHFVQDNMGVQEFDLVRFQKWGPDLKFGTMDEWNSLHHYFDTTDFTRGNVYEEVSEFMDMNSLLNLLSLVHCTQFRSWTWGAFAIKPEGGRWSWTIWDTDRSYLDLAWNGFTEYAYTGAEKWPNFIPQNLVKNERFRHELINRNCDLMNSLLAPELAISIYDSLVNIIEPEMDAEYERWKAGMRFRWDDNNESVRAFLRKRPAALYEQMKSYFGISDTTRLHIQIVGKGKVKLNSLLLDQEVWSGIYMDSIPVLLEAVPDAGSNFIEWRGISTDHTITIVPAEIATIVAVFDTVSDISRKNLVINEIMYNPLYPGNSEWIEIYNPNELGVSLEGFKFSDGGLANFFTFPSETIIDPQDYIVLAGDLSHFVAEFGLQKAVSGSFNLGVNGFNLSNGGETIFLMNSNGELEDQVQYRDISPWPVLADGYGPSLQLASVELENFTYENWYADSKGLYTPGAQNSDKTRVQHSGNEFLLNVYPNPCADRLFIALPGISQADIVLRMFTLSGEMVAMQEFQYTVDHEPIAWDHGMGIEGMYILKISISTGEGQIEKAKLVVVGRQ